MRRLRDLPGISSLEGRAVMNPELATAKAGWFHEEITALARQLFGLTNLELAEKMWAAEDEHEDDPEFVAPGTDFLNTFGPSDWRAVEAGKAIGWDLTDEHGRPMLVMRHFVDLVVMGHLGLYGVRLPDENPDPETWGDGLEEAARKFKPRRD